VVFVRASIEKVACACAERTRPARWEQDIAKKKVPSATRYTYLLQLKDSAWTSILVALGNLSVELMREAESLAREISRQLATRACTWGAENTSGAEDYEIFERGESVEKAIQDGTIKFESKQRPPPKFKAELFPEPVFANEGIRLPACYPKDDGYEIRLVLEGLQRDDVARADLLVWEE
jgi:hypothetical protein